MKLSTIGDVERELAGLDTSLHASGHQQLQAFNHTYLIITRAVMVARDAGQFDEPGFLERFDAEFARYYIEPLLSYMEGKSAVGIWGEAFRAMQRPGTPVLIQIAQGVNVHVNHDIPLVLQACHAQPRHRADFRRINHLIYSCLDEVLSLTPPRPAGLGFAYKQGMNVLIRRWRRLAWGNFEQLQRGRLSRRELESTTRRIARQLSGLKL